MSRHLFANSGNLCQKMAYTFPTKNICLNFSHANHDNQLVYYKHSVSIWRKSDPPILLIRCCFSSNSGSLAKQKCPSFCAIFLVSDVCITDYDDHLVHVKVHFVLKFCVLAANKMIDDIFGPGWLFLWVIIPMHLVVSLQRPKLGHHAHVKQSVRDNEWWIK